jgi:hypothetical protein
MWYSGASKTDGKSSYWVLNHSAAFPYEMLHIDWVVEGEELGSIKYTYLREKNDQGAPDAFKKSFIEYGLQEGAYHVFYDVHAYNFNKMKFVDSDIEWHRTNHNGRIKALGYFGDSEWHCWNTNGENVSCQ